VQEKYVIKERKFPAFQSGDTVIVHYEVIEVEKNRTQSFKGVVIQKKGKKFVKTFTLRKKSGDIGIERIFMINQPSIKKIEINKKGKVRRSRIYYLRNLKGKKAIIKEKR
jgi:large subunit ribosomal protein L19